MNRLANNEGYSTQILFVSRLSTWIFGQFRVTAATAAFAAISICRESGYHAL